MKKFRIPETPRDPAAARAFLDRLHSAGLLYHPDDLAADCLAHHRLAPRALRRIEAGMEACRAILPDPSHIALEVMGEAARLDKPATPSPSSAP